MRLGEHALTPRDIGLIEPLKDWVTVAQLQEMFPQYNGASLSVGIRVLRAHGYPIEKRHEGKKVFSYRIKPNERVTNKAD